MHIDPDLQKTIDYYLSKGTHKNECVHHPDFQRAFQKIGADDDNNHYVCWQSDTILKIHFSAKNIVLKTEIFTDMSVEEAKIQFGYRLPRFLKTKLTKTLQKQANAERALTEIFGPRLLALTHLDIHLEKTGKQRRRFRIHGGAILEIEIGLRAEILSYQIWTGIDAANILTNYNHDWGTPFFKDNKPIVVGSWGEALLVIDHYGGKEPIAKEKWHPIPITTYIAAETKDGLRQWQFHIENRKNLDSSFLGKKNRPALNPANVVLWARRIEKENTVEPDSDLSHETQRVILALRQWLKYLPKKERTFKKEYMNSAVSQWMYENKSDYFTRDYFDTLVENLEKKNSDRNTFTKKNTKASSPQAMPKEQPNKAKNEVQKTQAEHSENTTHQKHLFKDGNVKDGNVKDNNVNDSIEPEEHKEESTLLQKKAPKSKAPIQTKDPPRTEEQIFLPQTWNTLPSVMAEIWLSTKMGFQYLLICLLFSFPTIYLPGIGELFPIFFFAAVSMLALLYGFRQWPRVIERESQKLPRIELSEDTISLPTIKGNCIMIERDEHFSFRYGRWEFRIEGRLIHCVWLEIQVKKEIKALIMSSEHSLPTNTTYPLNKPPIVKANQSVVASSKSIFEIVHKLKQTKNSFQKER